MHLRSTYLCVFALSVSSALCLGAETMEATEPEATEVAPLLGRPAPEGVPSLQMSSDFATPGMAFGAYMPLGQVESRGIRVAPFTIRAAVNTGVGYDDNVVLRDSNKISSMFFSLSISVAVGLEGDTGYRKLRYVTNEGVSTGSDYDQFDVGGGHSRIG